MASPTPAIRTTGAPSAGNPLLNLPSTSTSAAADRFDQTFREHLQTTASSSARHPAAPPRSEQRPDDTTAGGKHAGGRPAAGGKVSPRPEVSGGHHVQDHRADRSSRSRAESAASEPASRPVKAREARRDVRDDTEGPQTPPSVAVDTQAVSAPAGYSDTTCDDACHTPGDSTGDVVAQPAVQSGTGPVGNNGMPGVVALTENADPVNVPSLDDAASGADAETGNQLRQDMPYADSEEQVARREGDDSEGPADGDDYGQADAPVASGVAMAAAKSPETFAARKANDLQMPDANALARDGDLQSPGKAIQDKGTADTASTAASDLRRLMQEVQASLGGNRRSGDAGQVGRTPDTGPLDPRTGNASAIAASAIKSAVDAGSASVTWQSQPVGQPAISASGDVAGTSSVAALFGTPTNAILKQEAQGPADPVMTADGDQAATLATLKGELKSVQDAVQAAANPVGSRRKDDRVSSPGAETVTDVRTLLMNRELQSASSTPATVRAGAEVPLEPGKPGFAQAMGEKVMAMMTQKVTAASIVLDPRELGPIEIKIQQKDDQTTIAFHAHHAVTREQLEASLPKLRDLFQQSGLTLANVSVGSGGQGASAGFGGQGGRQWQEPEPDVPAMDLPSGPVQARRRQTTERGVDYYA